MQNILSQPCRQIFKMYGSRKASFNNACNIFNVVPKRSFCVSSMSMVGQSKVLRVADEVRMKQVEVDELEVQKRLGKINMDFVRKAEKRNKERASMHRFFRRKDWLIAAFCFSLVIGIYSYTIWAIQQEKFLDDFEMPEEIDRTQEQKK